MIDFCKLLVWIWSVSCINGHERVERSVSDIEIHEAAEFALFELSKLSDSGIYTTLSLTSIESAASQTGVFHYNIYLKVHLSSPHLQSEQPFDVFNIMVMRHLETNHRNFAIDTFPVMKDDAIEEFWIQMVENHREKRQNLFALWDSQRFEPSELEEWKAKDLRKLAKQDPSYQTLIDKILDQRWAQLELMQQQPTTQPSKDEL